MRERLMTFFRQVNRNRSSYRNAKGLRSQTLSQLTFTQEEQSKVLPDANPIGPAILAGINAGVGLSTLANPDAGAIWAFGWNTFVVFAGCLGSNSIENLLA